MISTNFEAQDALIETNLETNDDSKIVKFSGLLAKGDKNWLIDLIKQYKDYFA